MASSLSTIKLLYDYNRWANARLLAACEPLTLEQWGRRLGCSWGSVHGLFTHILAAQVIWLARWKGDSPRALRQEAEFPTFADLEKAWLDAELALIEFINSLNEKSLTDEITYTNTRGETYTYPLGQLMLHLVNHSSRHRGELAAMLTLLSAPHPEDDLLLYLHEQQRERQK